MVFTEGIFITYAYAMGKTDPAVGTFTIMSLQQVPCESISEFSSSMNSLISEGKIEYGGHSASVEQGSRRGICGWISVFFTYF